MSIAEMINQGTKQQSQSWSVLSENLGRLGQQVGQQLAMREYQKQAAEALPAMQQQMQAALQDAGSGRSADAYSKLLPLISNPAYNQNPILLPGLEYIMKATKDTSDDFLMKQKAQQGSELSLADAFIASQLGMPLPQKPGAVTPPATGQPPTTPKPPATGQPPIVEPAGDVTTQDIGDAVLIDDDERALQESSEIFANAARQVKQEGTGLALSSMEFVDESQFSDKNIEDKFSIIPLPRSASKFLGEGIDSMAVPKDIEGLRQSGLTLKGQYGNINFSNINNSEKSKELRQLFLSTINTQINRLNNSKEINELISYYGGFDKIGPPSEDPKTGNIFWKIEDKEGKVKTIKLGTGTKDNPGLKETFLGVINAPNHAAIFVMPMLRSNMPAPKTPAPKVPQNSSREKSLADMLQGS
jgi:hypothetical protein